MDAIINEILPYLPPRTGEILEELSYSEQRDLREIRMKENCPLLLVSGSGRKVCSSVIHTKEDVERTFRKICASSAYTHRNEIRSGYVTVPGGHRVGICGTAVLGDGGRVEGMREISGLTVRVARDHPVDLSVLLPRIIAEGRVRNLLLAGPPCSGKTTVLRSLARELAKTFQVSVVDEREELFPGCRPVPLGCDVLRGYPKSVGILQALRTLSPQVVICDEIGTEEEVSAMTDGLRSGVSVIVSAHAYAPEEVLRRPPVRRLVLQGGIDLAAFLDRNRPGTVSCVVESEEFLDEDIDARGSFSSVRGGGDRLSAGIDLP